MISHPVRTVILPVLAAVLFCPSMGWAEDSRREHEAPPPPVRKPSNIGQQDAGAPEPVRPETPPLRPEGAKTVWEDPEIITALNQCLNLLSSIQVDSIPLPPIRDGRCGAPAPVKLSALSASAPARIKPPATVTCALAAALHKWVRQVVQPAAATHFNSRVAALRNISSYKCRKRYNDPTQRISEHALANALDISTFILDDGETVSVLDHWQSQDEKGAFLRKIHAGACAIFGTVLGPEANAAHADHFHLDKAKRRGGRGFCE